jgi:hypothetical protein
MNDMNCNECKTNPVNFSMCRKHYDEAKHLQIINDPEWMGLCGCTKEDNRWIVLCDEHLNNNLDKI